MIKRMVIMLVAVAVVFGGIFGFQAFKAAMIKKFISALSNPPQTISAAKAATSEWQPKIEAIGTLRAVKGADLSLEVSGVVESISFNSGDDVAEGAPLLKLRTADDVARLQLAAGDGGVERHHLRARPEAVQDAGGQPGDARYRRRQSEKRARRRSPSSRPSSTRNCCARRSPAISASAPSISANISGPAR